jgi:sulfite exporter TauE/SafE
MAQPDTTHRLRDATIQDIVLLVIAIGLSTGVNLLTFGVLWDAVRSDTPGISENATQILTGAFGGMIGIIGASVGYRAGARDQKGVEP